MEMIIYNDEAALWLFALKLACIWRVVCGFCLCKNAKQYFLLKAFGSPKVCSIILPPGQWKCQVYLVFYNILRSERIPIKLQ
jgi:hypothetical protein